MGNKSSSTAAKSKGPLQGRSKGLKSTNSDTQPNSTGVSGASVSVVHDPGPGNDAESAELTISGKYIGAILVLSRTTQPLAKPASVSPQSQVSDWKTTAKERPSHLGSSSIFNNININIYGTIHSYMVNTACRLPSLWPTLID